MTEDPLKNYGPQFKVRLVDIIECFSPALFSYLVQVKNKKVVEALSA